MFPKAVVASVVLASLALQGYAHAGIAPALGVSGTLARSDVRRANNSCGGADVGAISTSTAVTASAAGVVSGLTVTNFNGYVSALSSGDPSVLIYF